MSIGIGSSAVGIPRSLVSSSFVSLDGNQNIAGTKTFSSNLGIGTNTPTSKLDISDTWNNSGTTFTGVKLNITDTASSASSLLMDLQVSGVSRFSVKKTGGITTSSLSNTANQSSIAGVVFGTNGNGPTIHGTNLQIGSSSTTMMAGVTSNGFHIGPLESPAYLRSDASNILAMRNGTGLNPQTFRLYNTYTDASNYERGFFTWNSNIFYIGTQAAGTGSLRNIEINCNSLTLRDNTNTSANFYISNGNGSSNLYLDNINNSQTGNIYFKDRNTGTSSISIFKVNGVDKHNFTLSIKNNAYINITNNILSIGDRLIGNINEIYFNNVTDNNASTPAVIAINGGYGKTTYANVAGGNIVLAGGKGIGSGLGGDIIFQTTPNVAAANTLQTLETAMTIKASGNVGIGTTTPAAKLDISDTTGAASGSLAASALNIAQTWNTTGTPTAIKLNVTDTASNAASLLMDLRVGGNSKFSVRKDGYFSAFQGSTTFLAQHSASWFGIYSSQSSLWGWISNNSGIRLEPTASLGWANALPFGAQDLTLLRDAANTLAQRNSTSAQEFRLYNTYTSSTNFERFNIKWDTNVLKIGTDKGADGGSGRPIVMESYGGITMRNLTGSSTTLILETKDSGSNSLVIKDFLGAIKTLFNIYGAMQTTSGIFVNSGATLVINGGGSPHVGLQVRTNWSYIDTAYFKKISLQTSDLTCWLDESDVKQIVINKDFSLGLGTTTPASKLTITGGDAEVTDSTKGVILKSPDGTRYRITVANGGTLTVTAV